MKPWPFTLQPGNSALVLDSPHSGCVYPDDFDFVCNFDELRRAEDTHVEKLFDFAPLLDATLLQAHFPRSYLDANRAEDEIDEELLCAPWGAPVRATPKTRLGKGLVWRLTDEGVPIYGRPLRPSELRRRIEECWRPYHAALDQALDAAHARHGYCVHLNCHSMPSVAASHATEFPGEIHPDFVIGDRDGSTAARALSSWLVDFLSRRGHSVSYNHPYKGVELIRRSGNPARGRHAIQLEINRKLYMNEQTLALNEGFPALKELLCEMAGGLFKVMA
jgi:N-formylglutamate deformylase